ncbi:MAG: anthranilate phosphoribosyltransferase [Nitrospiraceae bacterium]|nr:anthranilate phosphoribosyltransferase [Nitrospiraceae bacterium]
MIKEALNMLTINVHLSEAEMAQCMEEIMDGKATPAQIGAFLTALRMKGETVEEITGAAMMMRKKAISIKSPAGTLDTCGTGGDMSRSFNVSTISAVVVSACGAPVAKHGNRSVSSSTGSADVLEALGVKIDLPPEKVEKCLFETGFGFLFAPLFHPAMKYAVGPRKEIGLRTIFNILGPLTNPAGARRQLMGVFTSKLTNPLAEVLGRLGSEDAMVVHGADGLDEITICDGTRVSRFANGRVEDFIISPEDFNLKRAELKDIQGGNKEENAKIALSILKSEPGPMRDIVLMNSAAALLVANAAGSMMEGYEKAAEAIDSGRALKKLEEIIRVTQSL